MTLCGLRASEVTSLARLRLLLIERVRGISPAFCVCEKAAAAAAAAGSKGNDMQESDDDDDNSKDDDGRTQKKMAEICALKIVENCLPTFINL